MSSEMRRLMEAVGPLVEEPQYWVDEGDGFWKIISAHVNNYSNVKKLNLHSHEEQELSKAVYDVFISGWGPYKAKDSVSRRDIYDLIGAIYKGDAGMGLTFLKRRSGAL